MYFRTEDEPDRPGRLGRRRWQRVCYPVGSVLLTRYQALRDHLLVINPDLVFASDEVDGDLLDWFATLPPKQRLDRAARMGADLERLRHGRRAG